MSLALVLSLALSQAPTEAAPAPAPTEHQAVPASMPPDAAPNGARAPLPPAPVAVSEQPWWQKVTLTGFARIGVFYTLPTQEEQLVGGNGGFRLADFRLGLDFKPIDKLWVSTSVEFAAPLADAADPLNGRRIVDLRDAFVQYDVANFLQVRAGQFRPPYYAEMLMSDGAIPFVNRSVLAGGLHPPEGYPKNALAPDRQLGVQIASARLGSDAIGFKYALGVFNGNGQNQLFNDNNSVEPVGRIEVDVFKTVTLGLNGYYNQRADGARPNRVTSNQLAYGADLSASFFGFTLLGAVLGKSITYSYAGLPADSQLGALGQLRYFHEGTGLEAAARFAWYEPSSAQTADQVTELAGMIGWRPFKLPFRVLVQYTHRGEEAGAAYDNDSVDAMLHAVW